VDKSASTSQLQPRVVYVVQDANTGQVHPPPVSAIRQANAGQQEKGKKTFIPQIILACFVFWLFGLLFGLIAFILARKYCTLCFILQQVQLFMP